MECMRGGDWQREDRGRKVTGGGEAWGREMTGGGEVRGRCPRKKPRPR